MPKSWRDVLAIHPAAELFPLMSPDELRALGDDIKANGLHVPIAVWSDGKSPIRLVDGISRLDAIEIAIGPATVGAPSVMAGKDFLARNKVITLDKSVDPYAYVISANIHRRHLTAELKRDLIAKLIKATPGKSDRQIAETTKTDHKTVAAVRTKLEGRGEVPHVETRTDSKGRQQPVARRQTERKPKPATTLPASASANGKSSSDNKVRNDVGPDSAGEIARKDARIEELANTVRRLEMENIGLRGEVEDDANAVPKLGEGEGDAGNELGNLLRAWDRASSGAREKFKVRVGLVAEDGLDIPACLRRSAS
jgi:hypothetical protein